MQLPRRVVIFVAILLGTLAFDQGSKAWAKTLPVQPANCSTAELAAHRCHGVPQTVVEGFWEWELALNDGAAFSSLRGQQIVLSLISVGALVMLVWMAHRTKPEQRLQRAAYAMIAGGALGNLVDRVRHRLRTLEARLPRVADLQRRGCCARDRIHPPGAGKYRCPETTKYTGGMRLAVVALLLIGCKEPKDFDPLGGGGPGGVTGLTDAPRDSEIDGPTDANLRTGRACVVKDLRRLSVCEDSGVSGIVVQIGNVQTEAEDDGAFTIDLPSGTGLTWQVFHPDYMTSISQLGTSFVLNTILIDDYSELLGDNGIILTGGQSSSVVVQVLDTNNAPLVGATAVTSPGAQFQTRYDGNSAATWDQDSTGAFGVAWLPGTTGTSTQLTVTPPAGGGSPVTLTIPLTPDSITFATVSF